MLILERPWTRQPQGAVGVNWGNPLTRNLRLCLSPGVTGTPRIALNFATGKIINGYNVNVLKAGVNGVGYVQPQGANIPAFTGLDAVTCTEQTTAMFISEIPTAVTSRMPVFDMGRGHMAFTSATQLGVILSGGSDPYAGATPYTIPNRPSVLLTTYAFNDVKMYADGVLKSTYGSASTTSMSTPINIGGETAGGYTGSTFTFLLAVAWDRVLSAAEVFSFSMNPWQLFAPQQIIIPTPAAATAPTITALSAISITATSAQPRITYA